MICPCGCGDLVREGNTYAHRWCRWRLRPSTPKLAKPCARGGCTAAIVAGGPKTLEAQRYCSVRCHALARLLNGWRPQDMLTAEQRRRGGIAGGKKSAETRHREAIQARADLIEKLIPDSYRASVPHRYLLMTKALIARGVSAGYRLGQHTAVAQRTRRPKTRAA